MTPISVIIYINGVLFYPNSVTVTAARNELATFSVILPSVPELELLPPRSHCVVFYTDSVSQLWRMMVEGEYIGTAKSKTSDGRRHATLEFRSLVGIIQTATNSNLSSLAYRSTDATGDALKLVSQGKKLTPSSAALVNVPSIATLVASLKGPSLIAANFFPFLMGAVLKGIPVEGYYWVERKVESKMYALPDDDIVGVIQPAMVTSLAEFYNTSKLQEGLTILSLIHDYESMMFYQHIPLLSPPEYPNFGVIPELLFTPDLHNVIPPACNVVFSDQIAELSFTRNFGSEPTRVTCKLTTPDGRSTAALFMANSAVDSTDIGLTAADTYPANSPGVGATHTTMGPDEMFRGIVMGPSIPVSFSQFGASGIDPGKWTFYFHQATKHYYDKTVGNYRTANLSCSFLPYIIAGVTCLVEDYTSPFHAYVESVTHILSNDTAPRTLLTLSHVRPAYVHGTRNKTPPLPGWLNTQYAPSGIKGARNTDGKGTWERMLGRNQAHLYGEVRHSAMLPAADLVLAESSAVPVARMQASEPTMSNYSKEQVNMDELAAKVVPVPIYDEKLTSSKFSSGTVAEKLRKTSEPNFSMMAYNWRQGISLLEYAKFHALPMSKDASDAYGGSAQVPSTLFNAADINTDGTPFFASPVKMVFTGKQESKYGAADLVRGEKSGALYNPIGQRAALLAAAALKRRITVC